MTREQVIDYICLGYNILENGRPIFVADTLSYLQELDEEETGVYVLEDLLTWNQNELDMIEGQKYYDEVGEYGRKLYLRNVAIRTGNWDLYEATVKEEFPDEAEKEIAEARAAGNRVVQMTKDQLKDWIVRNRVNMITSDLYVLDEGTILEGSLESDETLRFVLGDGLEDLIECHVSPMDVLNLTDHEVYWVDPVVKS
ncbi:hypothetical protein [Sphingobacterium detergens]|uniref:hypothetical protein n=1 Tax=Sphingobacterium detergens TaxID=1145106 RepID=UPI003AABA1EC